MPVFFHALFRKTPLCEVNKWRLKAVKNRGVYALGKNERLDFLKFFHELSQTLCGPPLRKCNFQTKSSLKVCQAKPSLLPIQSPSFYGRDPFNQKTNPADKISPNEKVFAKGGLNRTKSSILTERSKLLFKIVKLQKNTI